MALFETRLSPDKLHPSFVRVREDRKLISGQRLMETAFARLARKDRNFIEQFQTTGFDSRTFELYVSELLRSEDFALSGIEPQPDFLATRGKTTICIECTTANPSDDGNGPRLKPYQAINQNDRSFDDVKRRAHHDVPIRLGDALRKKVNHRVKHEGRNLPYWELPWCAGKPFIIAVQSFSEDGSLGFSSSGIVEYLYGIQQRPEWDASGKLIIVTNEMPGYDRPGKPPIPSGFFRNPANRHISAVLWSNAGTVPKFTRMGLAHELPSDDVIALHFGNCYDWDPNAHAPLPFLFLVGEEDAPIETWGQEAVLLRNPDAINPVPDGVFERLSTAEPGEDGAFVFRSGSDFVPLMSMTQFFDGEDRYQQAEAIAQLWGMMQDATYQIATMKEGNPVWK